MIYREIGKDGMAIAEYNQILKQLPHDMTILRHLAEAYVDQEDIETAKQHYCESIKYYRGADNNATGSFGWSDINIYIELFGFGGDYANGIMELKSLSRWLLGREEETFWDDIQFDDREWDASDEPRRVEVSEYIPNIYPIESYGEGLPLELRVKLGVFRLKIDKANVDEAMVMFW